MFKKFQQFVQVFVTEQNANADKRDLAEAIGAATAKGFTNGTIFGYTYHANLNSKEGLASCYQNTHQNPEVQEAYDEAFRNGVQAGLQNVRVKQENLSRFTL